MIVMKIRVVLCDCVSVSVCVCGSFFGSDVCGGW
jgi:hypothetical protein